MACRLDRRPERASAPSRCRRRPALRARRRASGRSNAAPARRRPGQRPQQPPPSPSRPPPSNETIVEPPPKKIANPTAVFSGLDKITGRIISFDVAINETVQFGALEVTPRACYSRPPTEAPNTDGFIEVDELTLQGEIKRIFTGWMFAASPGLQRGRASDLRRVADRLQRRAAAGRGRSAAGAARRRSVRSARAAARAAAASRSSRAQRQPPPPPQLPPRAEIQSSSSDAVKSALILDCAQRCAAASASAPLMVPANAVKSASPTRAASSSL